MKSVEPAWIFVMPGLELRFRERNSRLELFGRKTWEFQTEDGKLRNFVCFLFFLRGIRILSCTLWLLSPCISENRIRFESITICFSFKSTTRPCYSKSITKHTPPAHILLRKSIKKWPLTKPLLYCILSSWLWFAHWSVFERVLPKMDGWGFGPCRVRLWSQ